MRRVVAVVVVRRDVEGGDVRRTAGAEVGVTITGEIGDEEEDCLFPEMT